MTLDPNAPEVQQAQAPDANPAQAATAPQDGGPAPAAGVAPPPNPMVPSATTAAPTAAQSTPAPVPNVNDAGQPTPPVSATSSPQAQAVIASGHGSAGKILRGALLGILDTAGHVAKDVALSTRVGGAIADRNLARKGVVQQQQIEGQKAGQEAVKAADEHQKAGNENTKAQEEQADWKITHNNLSMAAVHTAFENHTAEDKQVKDIADTNSKFITDLQAMGVKPEDVKTFEQLGPREAQGQVNGTLTPVAGPDKGPNAGLHYYNTNDLKGVHTTQPMTIKTDYQVDPKTGELRAMKTQTLPVGTDMYEAWAANASEIQKGQTLLAQAQQKQAAQEKAADITQKGAETNKANAEATKARAEAVALAGGINDNNKNLRGEDFIKTLPAAMQDMVRGYIQYNLGTNTLPRGKEKLPFMEAVLHADPTFDDKKYEERYKYIQQYGSSTHGDGATRRRIATAAQHLALSTSPEIDKALAQHDVNFLNKIANAMGVASGSDADLVYNAIVDKAAGETAGAVKGGAGPATDPGIEKSLQSFKSEHAPQQRRNIAKGLFMILNSQGHTIDGAFTTTMGKTPEAYGQPVLPADIQKTIDEGIQTGTSNAVPVGGGQVGGGQAAGGQAVSIGGQSYNKNADGSVTVGGHDYVPSGNGQWALRQPKAQSPVAGRK